MSIGTAQSGELTGGSSLSVGCVQLDQKCANIVPVFKKGDNQDLCNYKAISMLSLSSKIAERIIFYRFFNFIADDLQIVAELKKKNAATSLTQEQSQVTQPCIASRTME